MTRRDQADARGAASRGRGAALAGLAVALLFALAWPAARPAQPPSPTDDLYGTLGVTRHLARGEGFRSDIAYPLSFAWPFARELPQPLVHRPPAWPVALLLPYAAAGGDVEGTIRCVRILQAGLLAAILGLGTAAWWRRGRPAAAAAWLMPMLACPLWRYAVDWGLAEVAAALLLLASWLRLRDGAAKPGAIDGALLGALALLRPELAWLPPAWWLAWRGAPAGARATEAAGRRRAWLRRPAAALAVLAALVAPWGARNLALAGDPLFSVQAQAELVKDTRTWPGYDVYRQLAPQPAWRVLTTDPVPVARKFARGVRFFARSWPGLLSWPVALALALAAWRNVSGNDDGAARRRRWRWRWRLRWRTGGLLALASTTLLAMLYAWFDHSLRHLLPMVPILAWEAGPVLGEWPWRVRGPQRIGAFRRDGGIRPSAAGTPTPPHPLTAVLVAVAVAAPPAFLAIRQPAGWREAAAEAVAAGPAARSEAERLRAAPPGAVVFVQTSAATWLADRPAVWSPLDDDVAARITAWLDPDPSRKARP